MKNNDFNSIRKVHFIGIGGIGMSALARMLLSQGKRVTGSDAHESQITLALEHEGIAVAYGQAKENVPLDAEAIIYTVAVGEDNPELAEARATGLPVFTYAEALGAVSQDSYTIAVSGTHGKTTTTAMIAKAMREGGLAPTVIVGSLLKEGGSNFVPGSGKYFLAEACEYKRSFLSLYPKILVITNIEEDHLDYYKDLADIQSAFRELALRVPKDGFVVCDPTHPHVMPVVKDLVCTVIDYTKSEVIENLSVPGEHNKKNAQAALAVAAALGVDKEKAAESLRGFTGTWRRFEYKGETAAGAKVYDDYAHHPTEIAATLQGAREANHGGRILAVFEPHLYSRTKEHLEDFAVSLAGADAVFLAPIYAARESFDPTISSEMIAEKIRERGITAESFSLNEEAARAAAAAAGPGDTIVLMGAGDIYKASEEILAPLRDSAGMHKTFAV